jgi:tRNA(fMet)-specific endonuclease VapC
VEMNKILIDTNIYSLAMRGDQDVLSTLRQMRHIGISAVSIGELLSGFRGGNREQKNRRELGIFLDSPRVHLYPVNENSAEYYSSVLHQLKEQRTPIPSNDIWIAAIAFQHGLALYTFDKHFSHITGLLLQ